jgi:predicted acyltransferase
MQRLLSLDVFRGMTIAGMILVNNPGSWTAIYPPLRHAEWHGWTPTDMVFPFFLWISGMAMTLSFSRRKEQGADKGKLLLHTGRRAATIAGLGLLLNLIPAFDLASFRIPGVLQRIGICYFFATLIYLYTSRRGQLIAAVSLLAAYTAVMLFLPFPGAGADRWSIDANAARYIDGLTLTGHMWRQTKVWDPEGVLSTVPAIVTVLCGILARSYVREGLVLAAGGLLLGLWIPINKSLWTPSFVLLMAGLASVIFGLLHRWIDAGGHRRGWKFFEIYGTNAIVSFVGSGAIARILTMINVDGLPASRWIYNQLLLIASPMNASLLYALGNVAAMFLVVLLLYRKRVMVRL